MGVNRTAVPWFFFFLLLVADLKDKVSTRGLTPSKLGAERNQFDELTLKDGTNYKIFFHNL